MTQHAALFNRVTSLLNAGRVWNPRATDILALAPHLSEAEAEDILARDHGAPLRTYFIGPPLAVRGALQVYAIDYEATPARVGRPATLRRYLYYGFATRLKASYCARPMQDSEQVPVNAQFRNWEYAERATDWAEINWHDQLSWDNCVSVVNGFLIAPALPDAPVPAGYYPTATFIAWLGHAFAALTSDQSEPQCEVLNDSITAVSYHAAIQLELLGHHRAAATLYYCSLCGGGIGVGGKCDFCDTRYNGAAGEFERPYRTALPTKLQVAIPTHLKRFEHDPIEARKWEHRKWAASNYVPPTRAGAHGREQRRIDLG